VVLTIVVGPLSAKFLSLAQTSHCAIDHNTWDVRPWNKCLVADAACRRKRLVTSDLTDKVHFLLSVADFANHAKFVFSWLVWDVYGFAIATKGSNHMAITHCCNQVGVKGTAFPQILDCTYWPIEHKLSWLHKANYSTKLYTAGI